MKNNPIVTGLIGCLYIGGIFCLLYAGWSITKRWNYYWGYQNLVEKQIRDIVKDNCLK